MNDRVKVIIGAIIFVVLLILADRILKTQNRGTISTPNNFTTSNGNEYKAETNVIEVTSKTFDEEVIQSDKKVLIDFYATWCGPCKIYAPIVDEVANERDDIKFVRIDVDEAEQIADDYSIYSIPTTVIIENGKEIKRVSGAISKEQLNQFIDSY